MVQTERESRTYRHEKCDGLTTIGGDDLIYVTHIFSHPDRTRCHKCEDYFPMHEFVWDDTGESLTDFYSRYAGMFAGKDRFFGSSSASFVFIALGLILGGVIGFLVAGGWGTLGKIGAAIAGALLLGFVGFIVGAMISERICKRILGTDDFTLLD